MPRRLLQVQCVCICPALATRVHCYVLHVSITTDIRGSFYYTPSIHVYYPVISITTNRGGSFHYTPIHSYLTSHLYIRQIITMLPSLTKYLATSLTSSPPPFDSHLISPITAIVRRTLYNVHWLGMAYNVRRTLLFSLIHYYTHD